MKSLIEIMTIHIRCLNFKALYRQVHFKINLKKKKKPFKQIKLRANDVSLICKIKQQTVKVICWGCVCISAFLCLLGKGNYQLLFLVLKRLWKSGKKNGKLDIHLPLNSSLVKTKLPVSFLIFFVWVLKLWRFLCVLAFTSLK